jgi:hypothetical protein
LGIQPKAFPQLGHFAFAAINEFLQHESQKIRLHLVQRYTGVPSLTLLQFGQIKYVPILAPNDLFFLD